MPDLRTRSPRGWRAVRTALPFVQFVVVWRRPAREPLSDEALLAAVALGDVEAATAVVRRYQRQVFGLALTITRDTAVAEDVAQGAFERAWRQAGSYDSRRGAVSTWLLAITRNLAIDTLRVRRPEPYDPADLVALLPLAADDPADAAVADAELARVRAALGRLPLEQRRAVLLATVACRTSVEIAELEGVPVPTAKHRVRSGLQKLRAVLLEAPS